MDSGQRHQEVRRRRQVRHHHPQRPACGGIPPSRKCGRAPTAPSAPCWTAPCSAHPSWSRAFTPCVRTWKKPITIARHAYGDVYKDTEMRVPGAGEGGAGVHRRRTARRPARPIHDFEGRRRGAGHAQSWMTPSAALPAPAFSYALYHEAGSVVLHQGHHLQDIRPPLQGHLRRRSTTANTRRRLRRRASPISIP